MRVEDFNFTLPRELVATQPAEPRDASRLLVFNRRSGRRSHRRFSDLPEYLRPGDALILNDTRVVPARLICSRSTGARVEALLVAEVADRTWHTLLDTPRKLQVGESLKVEDGLAAKITGKEADGRWTLEFTEDIRAHLERLGVTPLPPYMKRAARPEDRDWYQTVYARKEGAIAAPTAGLHFTPGLLRRIEEADILVRHVTLHVGIGTFKAVKCDKVEEHRMDAEAYEIPEETLEALKGRRVVAVGTTTTRTLESWARTGKASGSTDLFIYPPYEFKVVDALLTNFHVPRSTLLMLVSAFAGRERILEAYEEAKKEGYRFFSYGDAMLIE